MAMTPGLSKHTAFGFQLQTVEGTEASDDVLWIPVDGTVDLKKRGNRTFPRQADYQEGQHLHYSAGEWADGSVPFTLVPDATVLADLMEWIVDRDSYNQGALATVYKYYERGNTGVYESFIDCKVREATISLEKGRPVGLSLSVVGRKPGVATPTVTMKTITGPFLWKETEVKASYGGEVLAKVLDIERAEIRIDNRVEDPGEGLRLVSDSDGGTYPVHIYNLAAAEITGSLTRDFITDAISTAFSQQVGDDFGSTYDAALKFTLARSGVSMVVDVNRVQWMEPGPDFPGDNETRLTQDVEWRSLWEDTATSPTAALEYTVA